MSEKFRWPDYLAFIHTQPCSAHGPGCTGGPVVAHHEPPRSQQGVDADCIPLCVPGHLQRHKMSAEGFWKQFGIDIRVDLCPLKRKLLLAFLGKASKRQTRVEPKSNRVNRAEFTKSFAKDQERHYGKTG